jgi:hypothetical protein
MHGPKQLRRTLLLLQQANLPNSIDPALLDAQLGMIVRLIITIPGPSGKRILHILESHIDVAFRWNMNSAT